MRGSSIPISIMNRATSVGVMRMGSPTFNQSANTAQAAIVAALAMPPSWAMSLRIKRRSPHAGTSISVEGAPAARSRGRKKWSHWVNVPTAH